MAVGSHAPMVIGAQEPTERAGRLDAKRGTGADRTGGNRTQEPTERGGGIGAGVIRTAGGRVENRSGLVALEGCGPVFSVAGATKTVSTTGIVHIKQGA